MKTLHRRTLHQLGEEICSGVYRPGDVLPSEHVLGERLGVSRIIVREPMYWSLFDADVIAWRARTATHDEALAKELMELRRIVEPAACRFAAARISADERQRLRAAFDAMKQAVGGEGDYVAADLVFHTTILKACRNQFVQQMQNAMAAILRTSFEIVSETPGGPERSLPLHEALCRAIEDGNADAAERSVLSIIAQAESDLRERFLSAARRADAAALSTA